MDVVAADTHQLGDASVVDVQITIRIGLEDYLRLFPCLAQVGGTTIPDVVAIVFAFREFHPAQMDRVSLYLHLHLLVVAFVLCIAIGQIHPLPVVVGNRVARSFTGQHAYRPCQQNRD